MNKILECVREEEKRQATTIPLIASENFAYDEVRQVMGSGLMNKYAEGYPGRRYYQGNKFVDEIETETIRLACEVFGFKHANVQAYSGSPANMAVLMALATPGETIAGLKLSAGGHLTHGHPGVTFSGKYFKSVQIEVDTEGKIDRQQAEELILKEKPKVIFFGTTSYPWQLDFAWMGELADRVGAYLVADIAHISALVATGLHPNPVPYAHVVTMTTHKQLRGPRGAIIGITEKGVSFAKSSGILNLPQLIDRAVFPGLQGGPHMETVAGIGICLQKAQEPEFKTYAKNILENAIILASELKKQGLKVFGTENHLMVVDCGLGKGKEVAVKLEEAGIVVNANNIPHEQAKPFSPSGIRLGTSAVTTMGMGKKEMIEIARKIAGVIKS